MKGVGNGLLATGGKEKLVATASAGLNQQSSEQESSVDSVSGACGPFPKKCHEHKENKTMNPCINTRAVARTTDDAPPTVLEAMEYVALYLEDSGYAASYIKTVQSAMNGISRIQPTLGLVTGAVLRSRLGRCRTRQTQKKLLSYFRLFFESCKKLGWWVGRDPTDRIDIWRIPYGVPSRRRRTGPRRVKTRPSTAVANGSRISDDAPTLVEEAAELVAVHLLEKGYKPSTLYEMQRVLRGVACIQPVLGKVTPDVLRLRLRACTTEYAQKAVLNNLRLFFDTCQELGWWVGRDPTGRIDPGNVPCAPRIRQFRCR